MKYTLSLIFSLVLVQFTFAQNEQVITNQLEKYFEATQTKDWTTIVELANPKIFSFVSKDMLIQLYGQMESDAGMKMDFQDMEILHIKKEFVLGDTSYVPVDYRMRLLIQLNPDLYQTEKEIQQIMDGFSIAYSGQEIQFDREALEFSIQVKNTLIANSKKDENQWYFGEYRANDPIAKLIFPEEILSKLEKGWN